MFFFIKNNVFLLHFFFFFSSEIFQYNSPPGFSFGTTGSKKNRRRFFQLKEQTRSRVTKVKEDEGTEERFSEDHEKLELKTCN